LFSPGAKSGFRGTLENCRRLGEVLIVVIRPATKYINGKANI
jgi:hypothetical protein